ncbi:RNA polymerase sigma factor [Segetibacter koreensis]|uniref:RNA polymerase sigma factor n=1 Tax=Segetibacter koreensis TaxID=398037 RepID=UPI00037FDE46|nr:RNA polymerase sigma factor [Segetibacter koreensis]
MFESKHWKDIECGDLNAYSKAYVFYYNKLFNYGRNFTDNTAIIEDAIQSVFIMVWKNREKLNAIHSPHTYIFSAFRNHIFKEKKNLLETSLFKIKQDEDFEFGIDAILISKDTSAELSNRIQQALNKLTARQKEAIFLRFYEALSYEEVAQVMHISVKATYKLMARSLLQLKELM